MDFDQKVAKRIAIKFGRPVLLAVLAFLLASIVANYIFPLKPINEKTGMYEKHAYITWGYPFVIPYYLLKPKDYDPGREYPLVLVLHGASKRAYAAHVLAQDTAYDQYRAFVLVPIAPFRRVWALPDAPEFRKGHTALFLAMNILKRVEKHYPVDKNRIYVTGTSTGGFGTFGALRYYPDVFAAAVPIASGWTGDDAENFPTDVPVRAWHSIDDDEIPIKYMREIIPLLNAYGGDAELEEVNGYRHGSWKAAYYETNAMWEWLFNQRRN